MDVHLLFPLEDVACVRVVQLLLTDPDDLFWRSYYEYDQIKTRVIEKLSTLLPHVRLREKLESYVTPMLCEVERWTKFRTDNWAGVYRSSAKIVDTTLYELKDTIPDCWLPDGSIDKEKSIKVVVRNEEINPVNRFIFACFFCLFDDVLDLYNRLFKIEKAYLRRENITMDPNTDCVIRHWIKWLEGSTTKDWESFVQFVLETDAWQRSTYVLKRMIGSLSQTERSQCLMRALVGREVSTEMMKFGLAVMSSDEREVVFRENPVDVLKCYLVWPLRNSFIDVANAMWPYITEFVYYDTLKMIYRLIRTEGKEVGEILINLKRFWRRSPAHLKEYAGKDPSLYKPINLVLDYDFKQPFSQKMFFNACFGG